MAMLVYRRVSPDSRGHLILELSKNYEKTHSVDRGAVALNKLFPDLDLKFQVRGEIYIYI